MTTKSRKLEWLSVIFISAIFLNGCTIGKHIDANKAFALNRAFTKQPNNSIIVAIEKTNGKRIEFINSAMFSTIGSRHFYGISTDSAEVIVQVKDVQRIHIVNMVNCKSTPAEYLPNVYFDFQYIDESPQGLCVDGNLVNKVVLDDGRKFSVAKPGLFYDCDTDVWTGNTKEGDNLVISNENLLTLFYRKPSSGVNILIGGAIVGATAVATN